MAAAHVMYKMYITSARRASLERMWCAAVWIGGARTRTGSSQIGYKSTIIVCEIIKRYIFAVRKIRPICVHDFNRVYLLSLFYFFFILSKKNPMGVH